MTSTRFGDILSPGQDGGVAKSPVPTEAWANNQCQFLSRFVGPGDSVVDIGAGIGAQSRVFSYLVGDSGCVHAVEPDHVFRQILVRNIEISPIGNIILHPDLPRDVSFVSDDHDAICNVDLLFLAIVHLIKIDFSRFDMLTLNGAIATITRNRPFIACESNDKTNVSTLIEFAHRINYVAYDITRSWFSGEKCSDSGECVIDNGQNIILMLIPVERDQYNYHNIHTTSGTSSTQESIARMSHGR